MMKTRPDANFGSRLFFITKILPKIKKLTQMIHQLYSHFTPNAMI